MTEHKSNFPEFYITAPQPCPYLPGRLERKLFTHLTRDKPRFLIDNLLKGGFRRSQNIAYMPYCDACSACVPVRILVEEFSPRRSLYRIARANHDVVTARMLGRWTRCSPGRARVARARRARRCGAGELAAGQAC